ncbi:uncharacterized protein LOC133925861 [Phragmites australis]|uniref:uncharacterized protein LOC133925861 n=1 Tax=Phragmites australis TaxID=29695 RepID=UPI002D780ACC|nr:uncharacterized protein LOC133925861 [Phragmites australis]
MSNNGGSSRVADAATAGKDGGQKMDDPTGNGAKTLKVAGGRALISSANLLQLLPTGSVLAFQTLSTNFTNQGDCYPSNWWLTLGLVTFLTATCIFFAFTDSVQDSKGKVYHGVALPGRLHIFNLPKEERKNFSAKLKERGLKAVDWVHAFFTAVVFLTIAGSDVGLQQCFFPQASEDTKQLLRNLPLGMAVLSSFVFMIFPATRKGIRFDNSDYNIIPDAGSATQDHSRKDSVGNKQSNDDKTPKVPANRGLTSSANLLELLPTGTVLAFQALAATFTNQGNCHPSNWWLTLGLVTFLTATCIFFAFTDSVQDSEGKVYQGVALPGRLHIFYASKEEPKNFSAKLKERGLKAVDWVHAFFTAVVFLSIAGSDVGLQDCFFPRASEDTNQLLKNLPLGMAVLSSFVFMIFPPTRKGIGFDNSEYIIIDRK